MCTAVTFLRELHHTNCLTAKSPVWRANYILDQLINLKNQLWDKKLISRPLWSILSVYKEQIHTFGGTDSVQENKQSPFHTQRQKLTHNTLEDMLCGIMRNRYDMLKGQNKAISGITVCVEHPRREPEDRATHRHTHLLRTSHTHVQNKDQGMSVSGHNPSLQKEMQMLEFF